MNSFLLGSLIGLASGIIIFPIGLGLFLLIKNTKERRKIKRLMRQGKILMPIDPKDFNIEAWQNKKYGNIEINPDDVKNLNLKIFKKNKIQEDNPFEDKKSEFSEEFMIQVSGYLKKARDLGYDDNFIKEKFKEKNYPDYLIDKMLQNG